MTLAMAAKQTCDSRAAKRCRYMEYSSDDEPSKDKPFPTKPTPPSYIRIFEALSLKDAKDKNFVISPCSIHLAISLLANGSTGPTLKELLEFSEAKTLGNLNAVAKKLVAALAASTKKGPKLSFVTGIWVDQSLVLNPSFKSVVESAYKGKAEAVDFKNNAQEVSAEVNAWVKEATNGLIDSFVSKDFFDDDTKLALANAVYFKAEWKKKFPPRSAWNSEFFLVNGDSVEVPFMKCGSSYQCIKVLDDSRVLRLPYRKSIGSKQDLSMHIILPNERDGLRVLVEKLSSDSSLLKKYLCDNQKEVRVGRFKLPKFKITFEFEATDILKRVGLQFPFSANKAEFFEMVNKLEVDKKLHVSGVLHKSCIEVNEKGTEAAVVSGLATKAAGCCGNAVKPVRVDFVADHPFMFVIREEKSGVILFIGHLVNPLLQKSLDHLF